MQCAVCSVQCASMQWCAVPVVRYAICTKYTVCSGVQEHGVQWRYFEPCAVIHCKCNMQCAVDGVQVCGSVSAVCGKCGQYVYDVIRAAAYSMRCARYYCSRAVSAVCTVFYGYAVCALSSETVFRVPVCEVCSSASVQCSVCGIQGYGVQFAVCSVRVCSETVYECTGGVRFWCAKCAGSV
jgi:hypothetical protein